MPRLGVLAFGDSITHGGGELQWGVALQSWALWVARGLGVPYTSFATDGATAHDVAAHQLTAFATRSAAPDATYDLACLYVGVNDVRAHGWEPGRFARDLDTVHTALTERAQRRLAVTIPRDLGRPRAGAKVEEANAIIERLAREHGALVVDLRGFGARNLIMADHVHPTAFGQVAIARRALAVLAADGVQVRADPRALVAYETTPWRRLRGDASYAYRHAKVSTRAAALALRARAAGRS